MKVYSIKSVGYIGASTDQRYIAKTLPKMKDYCDLNLSLNTSFFDTCVHVGGMVTSRIMPKLNIKLKPHIPVAFMQGKSGDVLFGYGVRPFEKNNRPFVYWETFCPPTIIKSRIRWTFDDYRYAHKEAVRDADIVMTPLQSSAESFRLLFPEKATCVRIVPFFMPRVGELLSKQRVVSDTDLIKVLFVGSDAVRKGLPELIKAWKSLPKTVRQMARLHIVSMMRDGEVKLPDDVIHHGYSDDPNQQFLSSDILVFPTLEDAFGFVLVEGMAAGCAIVATDDPIRRDILGNDGAIFTAPTDTQSFANALECLILDSDLRKQLSFFGRERARMMFEPDIVAKQHFRCFNEAIEIKRQL